MAMINKLSSKSWIYPPEIKALRRTSFYNSWHNMIQRCDDPNYTNYHRWGGRGITYPKAWRRFDGFYNDMCKTYKSGLSLDRIDNNKNYSIDNCRWATRKEQGNNQSTNKWLEIDGTSMTMAQWIEISGIKSTTVHQRYHAYGWSIKQALGLEPHPRARI